MDITARREGSIALNTVISSRELECITVFSLSKKKNPTASGGYVSVLGAQKLLRSMM